MTRVAWAGFVVGEGEARRVMQGEQEVRLHKRYLATHAVESACLGQTPDHVDASHDKDTVTGSVTGKRMCPLDDAKSLQAGVPGVELWDTPGTHICAAAVCSRHGP